MSRIIVRQENGAAILEFYASVFNSKSKPITENGKTFREIILPGTYDGADTTNTLATLFHDKNKIIGRTRSGTLQLVSDDYGLKAVVTMGSTQLHKDTLEQVGRGDLDECSFIGRVTDWEDRYEGDELIRYIKSIDLIKDVSIVSEGAYSGTNIIIREYMTENEKKPVEQDKPEPTEEKNEPTAETPSEKDEATREGDPAEGDSKEDPKPAKQEEEAPKEEEVEPKKEEVKEDEKPSETEEVKRDLEDKTNPKPELKMNKFELIREAAKTNQGGSVMIERAAVDGDTTATAKVTPNGVAPLSIMGKAPLWEKLGVDFNPKAKGTYTLPFQDPIVGEKLTELAAVTKDTVTPDGNLIRPRRFSVQKVFSLESIASATDDYLQKVISDMELGADRKISAEVYEKVIAGATEVADADLSKGGFDKLQAGAEVELDGAYIAPRSVFFDAKGVAVDAGSGKFLAELDEPDKGRTYEGSAFFYSNLFSGDQVGYGDFSKIHVADYGMTEVIIDKITLAGKGQIVVTVNKLADVALLNPNAFTKTPSAQV